MSRANEIQLRLDLRPADGGAAPPYRVRVSARAKQLQIEVNPFNGVEVIVPRRHSARRVASFVHRHRDWIAQSWADVIAQYPGEVGARVPEAIELRALGERHVVAAEVGVDAGWLRAADGRISLAAPDAAHACRLLQRFVAERARRELPPRLAALSQLTGLEYARVQLRGQRTLWGSCSNRGTISLNWKLLFVPPELVRYLMLHELAHTRHFTHSRAFWGLCAVFEPQARELDAALDDAWAYVPKWVEA
jgi:predicted metal-dependent hydrolase